MNAAAPARNLFIDLLRGIAILGVMCLHVGLPAWAKALLRPKGMAVVDNAYYFVTVFFVISGYLISTGAIRRYGSLLDIDMGQFARFRFGRIVPLLALTLVLLVTLGLNHASGFVLPKGLSMVDATVAVLSMQFNDWYASHGSGQSGAWNVMWSLSIEELFYVFLPILCRVLRSKALIVGWLLVSVPFALYARPRPGGLFAFSGCVDALSIGVLTALLAPAREGERRSRPVLALLGMATGLAGILYVAQSSHPSKNLHWGPLLVALATGVFILSSSYFPATLIARPPGRAPSKVFAAISATLAAPFLLLASLGRASYEAYLLHMPAFHFVRGYLWPEGDHLAMVALIGVGAYLVNLTFTEPANRLIRDGRLREPLRRKQWGPIQLPAFVALGLIAAPNLVVEKDVTHPSSVASVTVMVKRDKIGETAAPLVVFGEPDDADFVSIKKLGDGAMQLQFDHWGKPSVAKAIREDVVKDSFVVALDCVSPAALVEGVPVLTKDDLVGLCAHDELAIGVNAIGGTTMAANAGGAIGGSTITFNNRQKSGARAWRRGE
jgi:peptidoglycan/LPS O-acetylase OafA/YrhL